MNEIIQIPNYKITILGRQFLAKEYNDEGIFKCENLHPLQMLPDYVHKILSTYVYQGGSNTVGVSQQQKEVA